MYQVAFANFKMSYFNTFISCVLACVGNRLVGHVSDSPVDVMGTAIGISKAVTESKILQKLIEKSIDTYLNVFYKQVTSHMWTAHKMYHENPLQIPTLYLYSPNDVVSALGPVYKGIRRAKEQNIPHFTHVFDTPHVEHFRRYPDIYTKLLKDFFDFLKIKNSNFQFKNDFHEKVAAFPLWLSICRTLFPSTSLRKSVI